MIKSFDLFKIDQNGSPLWLGAMETLEEACERARLKNQRHPDPTCQFRVLNSKVGTTELIPKSEIEKPL